MTQSSVSIVLSPVQLAAVMQGETVGHAETAGDRFFDRTLGALMVVGGAMELVAAGALLVAPDPSLVSKVVAGIAGENAAENVETGVRDLWTGHANATPTEWEARRAALALGCTTQVAGEIGMGVAIAVPASVGFALGALRAVAIRGGTIDLGAEEDVGGHTIGRHVGKDDAFLIDRVTPPGAKPAASTFNDLATGERVVSQAVAANRRVIAAWAHSAAQNDLPLVYDNAGFFSSGLSGASSHEARRSSRMPTRSGSFSERPSSTGGRGSC